MDTPRFGHMLGALTPAASRRIFLPAVTATLLAFRSWPHVDDAAAKGKRKRKNKKRKNKKRKQDQHQQEESCAESCHQTCARCFHRPDGVPLCSSQGGAHCAHPCVNDSDCVGTGNPYCTTGQTHFASGTTQLWDCPSGFTSFCADVAAC